MTSRSFRPTALAGCTSVTDTHTDGQNAGTSVVVGGVAGTFSVAKVQTPLHEHRLRTCTTPTDKLTTILQLVVQQICHIAVPVPSISTCFKMLGCGKFLSVGGEFVLQQVVELL